MTTMTVAAYAALVLALPVILYQAYAFVLPALTPTEKRVIVPFLLMVPFLFVAGVVFAYFVVMPAAVKLPPQLQRRPSSTSRSGRATTTASSRSRSRAVGLLFQVPIGILAVTRLGIVTPQQLADEPPLRDPGDRGRRDAAAGHRPGDDADLDGAADHPVRGKPPVRAGPRQASQARAKLGAAAQRADDRAQLAFPAVLFDLQSPGRRRVIKVVYGTLAVLFVVGFVVFGVGSDFGGGGIADIFGGGGGSADENPFEDEISAAEDTLQTNPKDQAALLALAKAHVATASTRADVDEESGVAVPNSEAGEESAKAVDAWTRYVKLAKKPDPATAGQIANAYFLAQGIVLAPDASGRLAVAFGTPTIFDAQSAAKGAAAAQAILAADQPGANTLSTQALFQYYAGDTAGAQQTEQQALALAKKPAEKKQLQKIFDAYAQLGTLIQEGIEKAKKEQAAGGGGASGSGASLDQFGGGLQGGGGSGQGIIAP